jgi:hypothetical protein
VKGLFKTSLKEERYMVERYQMVACIGLRKSESEEMATVPLYIKVRAEEGSPLPAEQEDLIHRVSECMIRRYEQQLAEFIKNKNKGECKDGQCKERKTV